MEMGVRWGSFKHRSSAHCAKELGFYPHCSKQTLNTLRQRKHTSNFHFVQMIWQLRKWTSKKLTLLVAECLVSRLSSQLNKKR